MKSMNQSVLDDYIFGVVGKRWCAMIMLIEEVEGEEGSYNARIVIKIRQEEASSC